MHQGRIPARLRARRPVELPAQEHAARARHLLVGGAAVVRGRRNLIQARHLQQRILQHRLGGQLLLLHQRADAVQVAGDAVAADAVEAGAAGAGGHAANAQPEREQCAERGEQSGLYTTGGGGGGHSGVDVRIGQWTRAKLAMTTDGLVGRSV